MIILHHFNFPWANFAAVDESGHIWEFSHEPIAVNGGWFASEGFCSPVGFTENVTDWQNSLIQKYDLN